MLGIFIHFISFKKNLQIFELECIYNPIMAMGFSEIFTFQLDSNKW